MNVIIVDDEPAGRRTLREYCAAEADLAVIGEYGDGIAALEAIRAERPQLVFLDIQMQPLNGIELARALDPDPLPTVVFVTAHDDYAIDAFEVCAADYLLKPFDRERFQKTLRRLRVRLPATAPAPADERRVLLDHLCERLGRESREGPGRLKLLAELGGRLHVLDTARVEMIEADRNYVALRVGTDTYHTRSTLGQAEEALRSQPMLRISRSCLVNVDHVREVNRTLRGDFILVLRGGATVTSSEGFRAKVKEYLGSLRLGAS
jgi:two-component system LytT family response regulator